MAKRNVTKHIIISNNNNNNCGKNDYFTAF